MSSMILAETASRSRGLREVAMPLVGDDGCVLRFAAKGSCRLARSRGRRPLHEAIKVEPHDRRVVITALGVAQILAWGTSFYFPAVFAGPIVAETGWSLGFVVGGTSIGLLVAGLISPQVGRIIDRHGGRPVLLASSMFICCGPDRHRPRAVAAVLSVGLGRPWPRHGHRTLRRRVRRAWQTLWP